MTEPMWSDVAQAVVLDGSTVVAYEYSFNGRTKYLCRDDDGTFTDVGSGGGYNWRRSGADVVAVFTSGYRMHVGTFEVEGATSAEMDALARVRFREWVTEAARL